MLPSHAANRSVFETSAKIQIAIVDDHEATRRGLEDACSKISFFEVALSVPLFRQLRHAIDHVHIDLVALDLGRVGDEGGLTMVTILTRMYPHVRVLIYSGELALVQDLLAAGASGYVTKEEPLAVAVEGLIAVSRGQRFLCRSVLEHIERYSANADEFSLTRREWSVIELLAQGADTQKISSALSIRESSVYTKIYKIKGKLGCDSREELIAWYNRHRGFQPDTKVDESSAA